MQMMQLASGPQVRFALLPYKFFCALPPVGGTGSREPVLRIQRVSRKGKLTSVCP